MQRVGFFPGSFKPLHRGHYESIQNMRKGVDELHVLMSVKNRDDLSGAACAEYVRRYVAPTLPGVVFHYVDGTPVGEMYGMVEKLDGKKGVEVCLFAGVEDAGARYRPEALKRSFPKLVESNRIRVVLLSPVIAAGRSKRISGTDTREYLAQGDRVKLCEALPDISLVQNNITEIVRLFGGDVEGNQREKKK